MKIRRPAQLISGWGFPTRVRSWSRQLQVQTLRYGAAASQRRETERVRMLRRIVEEHL